MGFLRRFGRDGKQPTPADGPTTAAGSLTPDELAFVGPLVQQALGRDIVPDAARLVDAEEAARVDLPLLVPALRSSHRSAWEAGVASYYAAKGPLIRRSHELEQRAWRFEEARRYLAGWWRRSSEVLSGPQVWLPTNIPKVVAVLVLQDGDTVRIVMPSMLTRWGVSPTEVARAAGDRVACEPVDIATPAEGRPSIWCLGTNGGLWAGTLLDVIDRAYPDAVGPLGTLAALMAPNVLFVRPLNDSPGLRDDVGLLARVVATAARDRSDLLYPGLLWRRPTRQVHPVSAELSLDGDHLKIAMTDTRFSGVMTALDPRGQLPMPGWAMGILDDPESYTYFAGIVAAHTGGSGLLPADVGAHGDELQLPSLASICATVGMDAWPRVIGMQRRIGVRWQHDGAAQPKTLAGSFLAAEVRAAGPTVIAELQRVIDSMPEVTRAGVYGQRSLHVGGLEASGPPGGQLQAVAETELIVLVAYGAGSDERRDNDRLQAACAVSLPLGSSTALEPTRVDDPRFDDTEHLVVLR